MDIVALVLIGAIGSVLIIVTSEAAAECLGSIRDILEGIFDFLHSFI